MHPTKKILYLVMGLLGVVILVQFYIDTESYLVPEKLHKKRVEIASAKLVGYDDGKKNWEVSSLSSWTGANKYIFYVDYLMEGKLYDDDGKLILENLRADHARVNSKSRTIVATQNIYGSFLKSGTDADDDDAVMIEVSADELKYFSYNKKTYLIGNVTLIRDTDTIYAEKVELDNDNNILYIQDNFKIESDEYNVSANQMIIYIDDDISELIGDVSIFRPAETAGLSDIDPREGDVRKKDAYITADYLRQEELGDDRVRTVASGNVVIWQNDKILRGNNVMYEKDSSFVLEGGVDVDMDSIEWTIRKDKRDSFRNEDVVERLKKPVYVKADFLSVDLKKNRMILRDNVTLIQEDTHVLCKVLTFDDESDSVTLYQDVEVFRGEHDKLRTDAVFVDILEEAFLTKKVPKVQEEMVYVSQFKLSELFQTLGVSDFKLKKHPEWLKVEGGVLKGTPPKGAAYGSPYHFVLVADYFGQERGVDLTLLVTGEPDSPTSSLGVDQPEIQFLVEENE